MRRSLRPSCEVHQARCEPDGDHFGSNTEADRTIIAGDIRAVMRRRLRGGCQPLRRV